MADIIFTTAGNDTTGAGTEANPYATLSKCLSVASSGDNIFGKAGTYATTSQIVISTSYIHVEGYQTTPRDRAGRFILDGGNTNVSTNGLVYITTGGTYFTGCNFDVANHGTNTAYPGISGPNVALYPKFFGVNSYGHGGDGFRFSLATGARAVSFIGCAAYSNGNYGFYGSNFASCNAIGCAAWDNTNNGFTNVDTVMCLSDNNSVSGFLFGNAAFCTSVNNTTYGFSHNPAYTLFGCIAANNDNYGYGQATRPRESCIAYGNTAGQFFDTVYNQNCNEDDPNFVNAAGFDYTPQSTFSKSLAIASDVRSTALARLVGAAGEAGTGGGGGGVPIIGGNIIQSVRRA